MGRQGLCISGMVGILVIAPRGLGIFLGCVKVYSSRLHQARSRCLMSASRSEIFASTARRHASVHLTSAPSSKEVKVLANRRFAFSFRRSSRLACGPLPPKMACAAWCSWLHRWHSWPPGRLPVWHRGGVPSPNLIHLSTLLSTIVVKNKGENSE